MKISVNISRANLNKQLIRKHFVRTISIKKKRFIFLFIAKKIKKLNSEHTHTLGKPLFRVSDNVAFDDYCKTLYFKGIVNHEFENNSFAYLFHRIVIRNAEEKINLNIVTYLHIIMFMLKTDMFSVYCVKCIGRFIILTYPNWNVGRISTRLNIPCKKYTRIEQRVP